MFHLLSLDIVHEEDVVAARQRAAEIASLVGFTGSDPTRIATAVSEIVRNAFRYAGGGEVRFDLDDDSRPHRLVARIADRGPGIANIEEVLNGRYESATGLGMGIAGARRLADLFHIESSPDGTTVTLQMRLKGRAAETRKQREEIAAVLANRRPAGILEELRQQNQALLSAYDELQRKQQELVRLNHELEDTNRGVVALYAELDEKADHLRRADEMKSRFLSNMTHEFRTPVNSIVGLCNLIIDDRRNDGQDPEPEIVYIRKAAEQLSELVNDLLDLAKVEAGKTVVRPGECAIPNLFGALRGMLRPLLVSQSVALVFEETEGLPLLHTDEGKLSQILRNLISNALKFTERGEVRVSARADVDAGTVTFEVADTGIGIAPEDQLRIFEEFAQLEHRLQRNVQGTGLGLPLSRRLAGLLGGTLSVESTPGVGSTFRVTLPIRREGGGATEPQFEWVPQAGKVPILVVEDARDAQFFYEKVMKSTTFQVYPARTAREAEAALASVRPEAILFDIVLSGQEAWDLLVRFKRQPDTRDVPLLVVSTLPEREKALALGADAYLMKPVDRRTLLDTLAQLHARAHPPIKVLAVDDEEVARFLVRQCLPVPAFDVIEAQDGAEGLQRAAAERPDVIVLDLLMPGVNGWETVRRLRADPGLRPIPIVVITSSVLTPDERAGLLADVSAVLFKGEITREVLPDIVRAAAAGRIVS